MQRFFSILSWFVLGLVNYAWAAEPPMPKFEAQTIDSTVAIGYGVAIGNVGGDEDILLGGLEGIALLRRQGNGWSKQAITSGIKGAASAVRMGETAAGRFLAAVEPWHGNTLVYTPSGQGGAWQRSVLAEDLNEGHGLACADLLGLGSDQIVIGWRNPNAQKKVGLRLYVPPDSPGLPWKFDAIDDNTMACEDLKVADLDGDRRPDIVASGRSTHNLVIYWNKTRMKK